MSVGSIIGGVVGGVIGFFAGGPVGAAYGFAIGAGVGAVLDPMKGPTLPGPKLVDNAVQTAGYGSMIPRVYGRIAMAGNIVWLENNKLKATTRKKKQGGKGGGGKVTTTTVTYSATFALVICEGPIKRISKIWCSDKLIYNATSNNPGALTQTAANGARMRFYLGTEDQQPDPRYEAAVGVGNAPAFRGEAYIVFEDFQLADYSNTLQAAQFKVEVMSDIDEIPATIIEQNSFFMAGPGGIDRAYTGFTLLDDYGALSFHKSESVTHLGSPYLLSKTISKFRLRSGFKDTATTEVIEGDYHAIYGGKGYLQGDFKSPFGSLRAYQEPTPPWIFLRRYFRSGKDFYKHPFGGPDNTLSFSPSSAFIHNGDMYGTLHHPGLGVERLFQVGSTNFNGFPPTTITPEFLGPSAQLKADQPAIVGQQLFKASGRAWQNVSDNTFREYSLSGLVAGADHTIPGPLIDARFFVEDGDYVYGAKPSLSYIPNATRIWRFKNTFDEPAISFDLSAAYAARPEFTNFSNVEFHAFSVKKGLLATVTNTNTSVIRRSVFKLNAVTPSAVLLSDIVKTEMLRSGLIEENEIDTDLLTKEIRGYKVQSGSVRSAIEPLQAAFPFDVIQSGYAIKTIPRGAGVADSVQFGDIIPSGNAIAGDCLDESREMDSQLPVKTIVKYLDAEREYSISEQYAERINTVAVNRVDLELPLVLTATEAAGMAEVLNNLPWTERSEFAFALPPSFLHLEPADVITLSTPWQEYNLRIIEINYRQDGTLAVKARSNLSGLYVSEALGGDGEVLPDDDVADPGPSFSVLLDVPVIDESSQNQPGFGVAMTGLTEDWPGGFELKSADGGANFDIFSTHAIAATIGTCGPAMPIRSGALLDIGSTLNVKLFSGELSSVSESQMFGGSNLAAYGRDGRWEIIRFQNAALNPDGSYTLSTFWRGDFGTERYTGTHLEGDQFVLLEPDAVQFVPVNVALIGATQTYREVTVGADVDSDDDSSYTYQGVNLECYSPVHARADRDASGNMTITWKRRTRIGGQWRDLVDVPVGEPTLQFEIDIMSGSVVRRTFATTLETVTYTAAQQVTDFSAVQPSVLIRIYQLSPTVGRGYPLEVTV